MFFLKHWNGEVFVKTLPRSVQFHCHTWGYYKCQHVHFHITFIHWHALMGQNFLHISSTHLLQGSEVNQSKICLPEKWLVTTSDIWQYFTVIRLWMEKNLITSINLWSADNWIFIVLAHSLIPQWHFCNTVQGRTCLKIKKMSQLFHNTATLCPYAMCQKFKSQRECGPGLHISVQKHHSPRE